MKVKSLAQLGFALLLVNGCNAQVRYPAATPDARFAGYSILYLADESAQGLLSPRFMEDAIGALHLDVLSDAMAANESGNLDALMVHSSAIGEINADALAAIYDCGVVLVFFNVYSRVIGETLGDSTIFQNDWMDGTAEPMPGSFYIILWHLTLCRKWGNRPAN